MIHLKMGLLEVQDTQLDSWAPNYRFASALSNQVMAAAQNFAFWGKRSKISQQWFEEKGARVTREKK